MPIIWLSALPHLVMGRTFVEAEQELARFGRHDRTLIVLSGEGADVQQRVKPHDRRELEPIRHLPPQQVDALKAGDDALDDAGEDLRLEERFIRVRVLMAGPASPDPADHGDLPGMGGEGVTLEMVMGMPPNLKRLKQLA